LTLHLIATVLISACSSPTLSQFEVQRPSRITVPREMKKVFIREDLITANNDKLGIKSQALQELANILNSMGRFKVSVVKSLDEKQIEAEKETVAVIQGEVISGKIKFSEMIFESSEKLSYFANIKNKGVSLEQSLLAGAVVMGAEASGRGFLIPTPYVEHLGAIEVEFFMHRKSSGENVVNP